MARFFQNLDEGEKQIKRRTAAVVAEEAPVLSKTHKKLEELRKKVIETVTATKHFDKMAKKTFGELSKYSKAFDGGRIPGFLMDFLTDGRVARNAVLQNLAREFLTDYPEERRLIFGLADEESQTSVLLPVLDFSEDADNREEEAFMKIMEIISEEDRKQKLLCFIDKEVSPERRSAALLALFTIYSKRSDGSGMLNILSRSVDSIGGQDEHSRILFNRLGQYVERVYALLDPSDYNQYQATLVSLARCSPEVSEQRLLEFRFFRLLLNPETEHPSFKLLGLVRTGHWELALEYFNSHEDLFKPAGEKEEVDTIIARIAQEFAESAVAHDEYRLAFDILAAYYRHLDNEKKSILLALCVILNHTVKDTVPFIDFLEQFKNLDANALLLRSRRREDEILRSFFFLNMFDHEKAAAILEDATGIACSKALRDCVVRMAEKKYAITLYCADAL